MKKLFTSTTILIFLFSTQLRAQVGISTDPLMNIDSSAIMDIQSNNKGMLIPRMKSAERDEIINPAIGLMIYNIEDHCFNYHAGNNVWYKDCGRNVDADNEDLLAGQVDGNANGEAVAIEKDGSIYIAGYKSGILQFNGETISGSGGNGLLFIKLDSTRKFEWAASPGNATGYSLALDGLGHIYVAGNFSGSLNFGSTTLNNSSFFPDGFLAKYDDKGNALWAVHIQKLSALNSVTVDSSGNAYVAGGFTDDIIFESDTLTSNGGNDMFIAKYDPDGTYQWSRADGGSGGDFVEATGFTPSGELLVGGYFSDTVTFDSITFISQGNTDACLLKYTKDGNIVWAHQGGGTSQDWYRALTIDDQENIICTGGFSFTATFGGETFSAEGGKDGMVVKYAPDGSVTWAVHAVCTQGLEGYGAGSDAAGNIYITGVFGNTATLGDNNLSVYGTPGSQNRDMFIARCSPDGVFNWAKSGGGSMDDFGFSIATTPAGNNIAIGRFQGTAFFGDTSFVGTEFSNLYIMEYDNSGSNLETANNNVLQSQDDDRDPQNEILTNIIINGNELEFVESNSSISLDISSFLADKDSTNELQSWSNLPGIPAVFADNIDHVNDADSSPNNELISHTNLSNDSLKITEAGNTMSVDLSSLSKWALTGGTLQNKSANTVNINGASATATDAALKITSSGIDMILDGKSINSLDLDLYIHNISNKNIRMAGAGGNIAIGAIEPTRKLNVAGYLEFDHGTVGTNDWGIHVRNSAASPFLGGIRLSGSGYLEVTNTASNTNPSFARLSSSGIWTAVSDIRLKKDIIPASDLLSRALSLNPVRYHFKNMPDAPLELGFIAQEVQEILPELVEDGDYLTLNYSGLSVVAIGAIKEQQEMIKTLQQETADLKTEIAALRKLILSTPK